MAGASGEGAQITNLESAGGATAFGLRMLRLFLLCCVLLGGCAHLRDSYERTCDRVYDLGVVLDANVKGEAARAVKPHYDTLFDLCFEDG